MNTTRSQNRSKYNENNQNDLGTMSEMIDPKEDTKNDGNFQNDTVTKSEIIDNKESVENNESNKNETGRGLAIVDLEEGVKIDGNLQNDLGEDAKNDDSQDEIETRLEIIDVEESVKSDKNYLKETGTRSMMIDLGEGAELNDNDQNVPGTRSELINIEHCSENDGNNQNETGTISETIDVEEGPTEMPVEDPGLVEDLVTPVLKLLTFNIILPFIDIFFDFRLIHKLQHVGCLLVILSGLILHFIFTCFAWWRLEPRAQKKWSWIFLILQIWPQMKAVQVRQRLIFVIPDQNLHKKENYRSLVTWRHDITDHFIQC